MLLDFKWYTVMNDGNTIREDEAKFEDLINTKSNDITEFIYFSSQAKAFQKLLLHLLIS